ncbi:stalk domain-containing protein [Sporosarcina newyorkensis]|uniref:Copper amine oxidase N-terminal domain-containing protein n=1 Tax=Sporosarcina newyorkensis TaxID=759851 RepID=A0A1T4YAT8_9BACL|nr:stalk domain-containing protein [Sporosarcina newyorkensis]SKA98937.1 Copper amine oxidase N-terminal domain-containing protein [Sporosarcina newyorkensis]
MKMKKAVPFAMSALLVGGALTPAAVFANEGGNSEEMQVKPSFVQVEGTIESVEVGEQSTLYSLKDGEETNVLAVMKETLVFDNTGKQVELKKGDKIVAYTNADKPMIMIYPPQYSPDVVIVETEKTGFVAVEAFDEDLLSKHLSLKLNVDEKTVLSSVSGKEVTAADLPEKDLLVFYTMTTRSIPAQTTPEKVVVLDGNADDSDSEKNSVIEEMIAADHHMVNGVKMVPLRALAVELGYKVESTGKGAIISKDARSYTITRGEKAYGYNKSLRQFDVAPDLLERWKTYVPVELIEDMMQ